jgi:putative Holliday junction resolvase
LHTRLPELPLIYVDEYLTTTVAQEKLHQAGKKAKNFKPIIDQAAAVEILNNWLEAQAPVRPEF